MRGQRDIEKLRKDVERVLFKAQADSETTALGEESRVRLTTILETLDWTLGKRHARRYRAQLKAELGEAAARLAANGAAAYPDTTGGGASRLEETAPSGLLGKIAAWGDSLDWRRKIQLTVAFCLAIIIPFYIFRDRLLDLGDWGYLGAGLINGISSATIVLPAPGGIIIAVMGQSFNPWLIGFSAGIGGALGGSTSYAVGAFNSSSVQGKRWHRWMESAMRRFGAGIIFIFSLLPFLPGDMASIMAGTVRYPYLRYLVINGVASVIKMTFIAFAGADALDFVEEQAHAWVRELQSFITSLFEEPASP